MNEALRAHFAARDPSLALAAAAVLRCLLEEGGAPFGRVAVAYRHDHLDLHRGERGDLESHSGSLSVDEVRRHLESVIPRLATDGILAPTDEPLTDQMTVRFRPEVLEAMESDLPAARQALLSLAHESLHQAEAAATTPSSPTGSTLTAKGLTKTYKRRPVVDNVDLALSQGETVGLLGPNGAGKTTSFYMIVGLIQADRGEIYLDQTNISRLPMYKRARLGIGYLAQEPSIFRKLSVEDNVMAILETLPLKGEQRRQRLEELLDELSIKHLRRSPAYSLSGGERRRLEITRALVTQPKFMLLDEPFAGVDPIAVHDIQTIVSGLRRRGIGVLITDHNVEQTLDIVDRAYIMFEGKVQVSGTVRELVFDDQVASLYLGPTLTARLRQRLEDAA